MLRRSDAKGGITAWPLSVCFNELLHVLWIKASKNSVVYIAYSSLITTHFLTSEADCVNRSSLNLSIRKKHTVNNRVLISYGSLAYNEKILRFTKASCKQVRILMEIVFSWNFSCVYFRPGDSFYKTAPDLNKIFGSLWSISGACLGFETMLSICGACLGFGTMFVKFFSGCCIWTTLVMYL